MGSDWDVLPVRVPFAVAVVFEQRSDADKHASERATHVDQFEGPRRAR